MESHGMPLQRRRSFSCIRHLRVSIHVKTVNREESAEAPFGQPEKRGRLVTTILGVPRVQCGDWGEALTEEMDTYGFPRTQSKAADEWENICFR